VLIPAPGHVIPVPAVADRDAVYPAGRVAGAVVLQPANRHLV
jgi:hypothetical protein